MRMNLKDKVMNNQMNTIYSQMKSNSQRMRMSKKMVASPSKTQANTLLTNLQPTKRADKATELTRASISRQLPSKLQMCTRVEV